MYTTIKVRTEINKCIDITEQVKAAVAESGVKNGICILHNPHTTASIGIGTNNIGMQEDFMFELDKMFPATNLYIHVETPFDAAGHIKTAIVGVNKTLIIKDGKLQMDDEQAVLFYEWDGPRNRSVFVKCHGEK